MGINEENQYMFFYQWETFMLDGAIYFSFHFDLYLPKPIFFSISYNYVCIVQNSWKFCKLRFSCKSY